MLRQSLRWPSVQPVRKPLRLVRLRRCRAGYCGQQGFQCRPALRQERRQYSGEHIAGAGRGQAGVAGGVEKPATIGGGDDGAAALESDQRVVATGDFGVRQRCGRPGYLPCQWRAGEPLRPDAVSATSAPRARPAQPADCLRRQPDSAHPHQSPAANRVRRLFRQDQGFMAAAHSWPASECCQVGGKQCGRLAQHEFGLCRIGTGSLWIDKSKIDAAAIKFKRRASGEDAAPVMPLAPPRMPALPLLPLWLFCGR